MTLLSVTPLLSFLFPDHKQSCYCLQSGSFCLHKLLQKVSCFVCIKGSLSSWEMEFKRYVGGRPYGTVLRLPLGMPAASLGSSPSHQCEAQGFGPLPPTGETGPKVLVPSFSLTQPRLLWALRA